MDIAWDDMDPSELPEPLDEIARDRGVAVARWLIEWRGGKALYVPTLARLRRVHRDKSIVQAYDGKNDELLARLYGVSRKYVRDLAERQRDK